jgi:hypothetical protein
MARAASRGGMTSRDPLAAALSFDYVSTGIRRRSWRSQPLVRLLEAGSQRESIPLRDGPLVATRLVWEAGTKNPIVLRLVEVAEDLTRLWAA